MIRQREALDYVGFEKVRNQESGIVEAAKCKSCGQVLRSPCNQSLNRHRQSCVHMQEDANYLNDKRLTRDERKRRMQANIEETIAEARNRPPSEWPNELSHFDSGDLKEYLHKKLAMFFFACSIPFRCVENKYFLDFVDALSICGIRYNPPDRRVLGSTILEKVYDDIEHEKKRLLENTDSVLMVDCWKNKAIDRKFLTFSLKNINAPQIFLTHYDTSMESEIGENLSQRINDAIKFAAEQYKTSVFGIVSDNDSKIVRGCRLSASFQTSQPSSSEIQLTTNNLFQSTCHSHSINLTLHCFVEEPDVQMLREIVNTFRSPRLDALIQRFNGTKLQNFPDTRFCYIRDTIESVLKNWNILRQICQIEDANVKEEVSNLILFNAEFKNRIINSYQMLTPMCEFINKTQDPQYTVAEAVQFWLSINLPRDDLNKVIQDRIKKAIWPVGFAANIMHHKYKGLLLSHDQRNIGNKFIENNLGPEGLNELTSYRSRQQEFLRAEVCSQGSRYWMFLSRLFPTLSKFCVKLMIMPASTAQLEGIFSNWSYIHNYTRNRLGQLKSRELLDIYYSLKHMKFGFNDQKGTEKAKKRHLAFPNYVMQNT